MHINHIIVSKFIKDCNERFQTAFFISWSILVFWKRNSECCSNKSEKPTNVESQWNLLKLYVSKALGLLNKNLIILCTPKRCNCLLSISKVCSQVLDSKSHKPAFSSRSLNCGGLKIWCKGRRIFRSGAKHIYNTQTVHFWTYYILQIRTPT